MIRVAFFSACLFVGLMLSRTIALHASGNVSRGGYEGTIAIDADVRSQGDPTDVERVRLPGDGTFLVEVRFLLALASAEGRQESHVGSRNYVVRRERGEVVEIVILHGEGLGEEVRSMVWGWNTGRAPWDLRLVDGRSGDLLFQVDSPPDPGFLRVRVRGEVLGAAHDL